MPKLLVACISVALMFAGSAESAVAQPGLPSGTSLTIPNVQCCSQRIISGAEPVTAAHFSELAAVGVRTVVSVDGAVPRVKLATNEGLRYVHIPIGYDGMSRKALLSLVRVVRETDRKVFVHCHHGKHRGPAAAAIACVAEGSADRDQALQILQTAGTSKDYVGLWRDVAEFKLPDASETMPDLVSVAPVQPLASQMVTIGREFEALRKANRTGWDNSTSAQHALLISEGLREFVRTSTAEHPAEFEQLMKATQSSASQLFQSLKMRDFRAADQHYQSLQKNCVNCHSTFRN